MGLFKYTVSKRYNEVMLPTDFVQRVKEIVPNEWQQNVFEAYKTNRSTTFRANTLKISGDALVTELDRLQIPAERVSWYCDAFILLGDDSRVLTESSLYNEGKIYVQSLSSMIPALILNPEPGELVLDLCAAPGSKTTQMAAMMENQGLIIANDLSTVRIYKLAHNLKLQGVTNVKTRRGKGEELWKEVKRRQPFDRVLADVPCSLEGRFSELDLKTYDGWSEKKVVDLAQRMRYLLWSAVQSAKPGGTIVYSTCTMSPEENEGVVDWVLKKERGAVELVDTYGLIDGLVGSTHDVLYAHGLTTWRNETYDSELYNSCRIFPDILMEGFFVAVLKRL